MNLHLLLYIIALLLWIVAALVPTKANCWYLGWAALLLTKII